jgi:hypothetical protein
MGASATGAGNPGTYTQQGGTLGYNEVCYFVLGYKITDKLLNY